MQSLSECFHVLVATLLGCGCDVLISLHLSLQQLICIFQLTSSPNLSSAFLSVSAHHLQSSLMYKVIRFSQQLPDRKRWIWEKGWEGTGRDGGDLIDQFMLLWRGTALAKTLFHSFFFLHIHLFLWLSLCLTLSLSLVKVCWHGFPQQAVFKLGTHRLLFLCDFICANKQHARMCRWDVPWLNAHTQTQMRFQAARWCRHYSELSSNTHEYFAVRRWTVPL